MEAAQRLKKLQHLELYDQGWEPLDIETLQDLLPDIESLALKGGIADRDVDVSAHTILTTGTY